MLKIKKRKSDWKKKLGQSRASNDVFYTKTYKTIFDSEKDVLKGGGDVALRDFYEIFNPDESLLLAPMKPTKW